MNDSNMENASDIRQHTFTIHLFESFRPERVRCSFNTYAHNGTLAMMLMSRGEEIPGFTAPSQFNVPYGCVTVNLPGSASLPPDVQFVDENNLPGIGDWLEENGIARGLPIGMQSGYVTYRAYRFDIPEDVREMVIQRRNECSERVKEHGNHPRR